MADTDEAIIQLKKEARNREFTEIETTGIYVNDRLIQFERQFLFGGILAVWVPAEFIDMPEAVSQMKYPSIERPEIIKTSLDTTVNFTFKWVNQSVESDRIEELSGLLKQVLKSADPKLRFRQEESMDTPSGNRVSLFAFTNSSIDDKLYHLFCIMILSEGVVQGTFNCLEKDSEQWKSAAWEVFTKMEEIKVQK